MLLPLPSSWPGLSRPSRFPGHCSPERDRRDKRGDDELAVGFMQADSFCLSRMATALGPWAIRVSKAAKRDYSHATIACVRSLPFSIGPVDRGAGERRKAPSIFLPRGSSPRVTPYGARKRRRRTSGPCFRDRNLALPAFAKCYAFDGRSACRRFFRHFRSPFQPHERSSCPVKGRRRVVMRADGDPRPPGIRGCEPRTAGAAPFPPPAPPRESGPMRKRI